MFTHLPPGQQLARTRWKTKKKEPRTHPGLFFISHSTREQLCVQGMAELLLNDERVRAGSGSGEEAICKV